MIHLEPSMNRVDLKRGRVTPLRDTTVLVDYADIRLLIDPPLQVRAKSDQLLPADDIGIPAIRERRALELPALDAMVLFEAPEMPLDAPVEEHLDTEVPLITLPSAVETVEALGFEKVHTLTTWQWIVLRKGDASITVTALPACDETGGEEAAMGCMVELRSRPDQDPYRIYFSGPTQLNDTVQEIADRYPRIDLGVMCLRSIMRHGVMMAIDVPGAVDLACAINPERVVPVHQLEHVFDWSRTDFQRAMRRRGHTESTVSLDCGRPIWFEVSQGPACPAPSATSRLGESSTRLSPGTLPTTSAGALTRAR
jgi:L-ascorbate metabolism protein UlaG (beta-lactamase superfamily)